MNYSHPNWRIVECVTSILLDLLSDPPLCFLPQSSQAMLITIPSSDQHNFHQWRRICGIYLSVDLLFHLISCKSQDFFLCYSWIIFHCVSANMFSFIHSSISRHLDQFRILASVTSSAVKVEYSYLFHLLISPFSDTYPKMGWLDHLVGLLLILKDMPSCAPQWLEFVSHPWQNSFCHILTNICYF